MARNKRGRHYRFTPRRKAALKKAQLLSARKRSKSARRRKIAVGIVATAVVAGAVGAYAGKRSERKSSIKASVRRASLGIRVSSGRSGNPSGKPANALTSGPSVQSVTSGTKTSSLKGTPGGTLTPEKAKGTPSNGGLSDDDLAAAFGFEEGPSQPVSVPSPVAGKGVSGNSGTKSSGPKKKAATKSSKPKVTKIGWNTIQVEKGAPHGTAVANWSITSLERQKERQVWAEKHGFSINAKGVVGPSAKPSAPPSATPGHKKSKKSSKPKAPTAGTNTTKDAKPNVRSEVVRRTNTRKWQLSAQDRKAAIDAAAHSNPGMTRNEIAKLLGI